MRIILILFIALFYTSCCPEDCHNCEDQTPISSTIEIYRGQVTYIDTDGKNLIKLYGTNQAIWVKKDGLDTLDIVEIKTNDNFESNEVKLICSPKLGHCHLDGDGSHTRIHIKEIGFTSNSTERIVYNGNEYMPAEIRKLGYTGAYDPVWIRSNYNLTSDTINIVVLKDVDDEPQIVKGKRVILHFTDQAH